MHATVPKALEATTLVVAALLLVACGAGTVTPTPASTTTALETTTTAKPTSTTSQDGSTTTVASTTSATTEPVNTTTSSTTTTTIPTTTTSSTTTTIPTTTTTLVTKVCPDDSEYPGAQYTYNPEKTLEETAFTATCGLIWQETECSAEYQHAGQTIRWTKDLGEDQRQARRRAMDDKCGAKNRWEQSGWGTELDDFSGIAVSLEAHRARDITPVDAVPILRIVCWNDRLDVYVNWGGAHVEGLPSTAGLKTNKVAVGYRFGDGEPVEQLWLANNSERIVLQRSDRRGFVNGLRAAANSELIFIASGGPHGDRIGTAWFELTGVASTVEPVLRECGW